MTINANTKIAGILKANPAALEAIISISPKFNKLRNPLLRKIMASRTSVYTASKVGGCSVSDFFDKLEPLGFVIDKTVEGGNVEASIEVPEFMKNIDENTTEVLDVREVMENGKDPFNIIMQKIKQLSNGSILKLVNTFEPVPLINILSKQGFEHYAEHVNENLVNTYFFKKTETKEVNKQIKPSVEDWEKIVKRFEHDLVTIDVRHLEMPKPMLTILEALETLPIGKALFVYHKRIPVFLLPELQERKMDYRIKEINDGDVHLLIFHAAESV
jgi:uncharacterized protein (DUF2249 family)